MYREKKKEGQRGISGVFNYSHTTRDVWTNTGTCIPHPYSNNVRYTWHPDTQQPVMSVMKTRINGSFDQAHPVRLSGEHTAYAPKKAIQRKQLVFCLAALFKCILIYPI